MVPTSSIELNRAEKDTAFPATGTAEMVPREKRSDAPLSAAAGELAGELLSLRTAPEIQSRILRGIIDCSRAAWAGLYTPAGKVYKSAQEARSRAGKLPDRVETTAVKEILARGVDVRPSSERELRSLPDLALVAGFRSEFETDPALVVIGPSSNGDYDSNDIARVRETLEICGAAWRNLELLERLRSQVFIDFLTGCYNRRAFEEHLTIEIVRARRYERPLSLMLLDLDHFKDVNDGLGHDAGDYVLQKVGETLRAAFRTTDRVCRFGGDEFAVIFPETPKDEVVRLAERLRRQLAAIFPDPRNRLPVTASIGVASYPFDGVRAEELVKATDRALYQAKAAGRNRVISA